MKCAHISQHVQGFVHLVKQSRSSLHETIHIATNATLNPDEKTTGATIGYNVHVANNNLCYLRLPWRKKKTKFVLIYRWQKQKVSPRIALYQKKNLECLERANSRFGGRTCISCGCRWHRRQNIICVQKFAEACILSLIGLIGDNGVLAVLLEFWNTNSARRMAKKYSHNKVILRLVQKGYLK